MLAGRLRYPHVFMIAGAAGVTAYSTYLLGAPAIGFVLVTTMTGFTGMMLSTYFVPFSLAADSGRRAATMSGGAQILGSASGPLAAAGVGGQPHLVLYLGIGWLLLSVAVGLWIAATHRPVETEPVT